MSRKSLKGGQFERDTCRQLSLWFSKDQHDDWFWRSSQSGGRATSRAKMGQRTIGHAGDIAATCSEGEPLTKLITLELKNGYGKSAHLIDLLDREKWPEKEGATILCFIRQAVKAHGLAGSLFWGLIHKRDKRKPVLYAYREFFSRMGLTDSDLPRFEINDCLFNRTIWAVRLDAFLTHADPRMVKRILKTHGKV